MCQHPTRQVNVSRKRFLCAPDSSKGPVKLIKRVKIAHSLFIFTVCVKSVPRYHFKLAYVVLQIAVKEFFENHF